MNIALTDQVVLITGSGRGIGRVTALMAARAGARVVLAARSADQLDAVAEEIRGEGGQALVVPTDVTDHDALGALVKQAIATYGRIDVLVNNAAANLVANLVMTKVEAVRDLYEVNVFSVFALTRLVLRQMIRQKSGRIITISSIAGKMGAAYNSAYASSKAALIGFTRSVARETAKLGITVNTVCPWHVDTDLVHEAMTQRAKLFGRTEESYFEEIISESPQRRSIAAEEIAGITLYLMSDLARGIHGQSINVCGGVVME